MSPEEDEEAGADEGASAREPETMKEGATDREGSKELESPPRKSLMLVLQLPPKKLAKLKHRGRFNGT